MPHLTAYDVEAEQLSVLDGGLVGSYILVSPFLRCSAKVLRNKVFSLGRPGCRLPLCGARSRTHVHII